MISRRFSLILAVAVSASALLGLTACQTYVNIPAQTGDIASADANGTNVRNLLGEALRGLRPESLTPGKYQVILPAGSTPDTYQYIINASGDQFTWADQADSGNVVDQLEIRSIRIRGLEAEVDIIRSSHPGDAQAPRQLVTVYLKRYLVGGWGTQRVRVWRMSVSDALLRAGQPDGQQSDNASDNADNVNPNMDNATPEQAAPEQAAPAQTPAAASDDSGNVKKPENSEKSDDAAAEAEETK